MILTTNMEAAATVASEHPEDDIDLFSPRQYRLSLWYFLFDLLEKKGTEKIIIWANRDELEFRIVNANALARAWGKLKGKTNMTYPKFSRAMRYYYRKNVIQKINGKRYTYRFIESDFTHDVFQSFNCGISRQNDILSNHNTIPSIKYCDTDSERSSPVSHDTAAPMEISYQSNGARVDQSTLSVDNYNKNERRRSSSALMEELIKQAMAGKSMAQMDKVNDLNNKPYLDILTEEDFSSFKNFNDEFGRSCQNNSTTTFVTTDSIAQSLAQAVPYVNSVQCSWGNGAEAFYYNDNMNLNMDQSSSTDVSLGNFLNYPLTFSEEMYNA